MTRTAIVLLAFGAGLLSGQAAEGGAAPAEKKAVRVPLSEPPAPPATAPKKAPPAKTTPASAAKEPAKKDAAKKDAAKKKGAEKDDEIGKIDGMEISRSGNRFMGLQIVGGNFRLGFYDAKKKPVAPDVARAVLRWDPKYKLGMERVVLVPGGGPNILTSEKFVRPPYNFKLTIVLLGAEAAGGDDAEPAGETHVIDFRQ